MEKNYDFNKWKETFFLENDIEIDHFKSIVAKIEQTYKTKKLSF